MYAARLDGLPVAAGVEATVRRKGCRGLGILEAGHDRVPGAMALEWLESSVREWSRQQGPQEQLDELASYHRVPWVHVGGHSGHTDKERCDTLAAEARQAKASSGRRDSAHPSHPY